MAIPQPFDVEDVVADSEDEDFMPKLTATGANESRISEFTSGTKGSTTSESILVATEPQLAKRRIQPSSDPIKDSPFSAGLAMSSTIADRAKTRVRAVKARPSPLLSSDVIELTSDSDDELSMAPPPLKRKKTEASAKPGSHSPSLLEFPPSNISDARSDFSFLDDLVTSKPRTRKEATPLPTFFASSSSRNEGTPTPIPGPQSSSLVVTEMALVPVVESKKTKGKKSDGGLLAGDAKSGKKKSKKDKSAVDEAATTSKSKIKAKQKELEVFKSKEFIDDEDDMDNDELALGSTPHLPQSSSARSIPQQHFDLHTSPSRLARPRPSSLSSNKRKSAELEIIDAGREAPQAKKKPKYIASEPGEPQKLDKPRPKPRPVPRRIIESDDEAGALFLSSSKDTGKANKSKTKARTPVQKLVLSEDEEDTPAPAGSTSRPDKPSSGSVQSSSHPVPNMDAGLDTGRERRGTQGGRGTPVKTSTSSKEQQKSEDASQNQDPSKENFDPSTPHVASRQAGASLKSRYGIGPRTKSTPMSDLIKRVNSLPGSPFPAATRSPGIGLAYSPYLKSSRSSLSRIAPLHPNRRTPPPPPPPPPPPRKTKKQLALEEKWEEELIEEAGGITEWACMSDSDRKTLRRAKQDREMGGWED